MDLKPQTDVVKIVIEDDGTITTVTGKIGAEVHQSAEQFLAETSRLMFAERIETKLDRVHSHVHEHTHEHEHVQQKG